MTTPEERNLAAVRALGVDYADCCSIHSNSPLLVIVDYTLTVYNGSVDHS